MNPSSQFETFTLSQLIKRKRFSDIALYAVWTGGLIGIGAAISKVFTAGGLETTTLVVSVLALLASLPVFREKQRIIEVIRRKQN